MGGVTILGLRKNSAACPAWVLCDRATAGRRPSAAISHRLTNMSRYICAHTFGYSHPYLPKPSRHLCSGRMKRSGVMAQTMPRAANA